MLRSPRPRGSDTLECERPQMTITCAMPNPPAHRQRRLSTLASFAPRRAHRRPWRHWDTPADVGPGIRLPDKLPDYRAHDQHRPRTPMDSRSAHTRLTAAEVTFFSRELRVRAPLPPPLNRGASPIDGEPQKPGSAAAKES